MKEKILFGIGAAIVIIVGFICFGTWCMSGTDSAYYYTQIDNSKIEQVHSRGGVIDLHGGMSYSYTLPAYNENGDGKDITFGTSRELREGAFICLTIMPFRGVIEWSEVQYNELPEAIRITYAAPANAQRSIPK